MTRTSKLILLVSGLLLTQPAFTDNKDPNLGYIKARQADMQLRKFNAGPLFAMAKGDMDYDAAMAGKLADNLKTLLSLDMSRAWATGTDSDAYEESDSKKAIWDTYPEIGNYGKKYAAAVRELADVAGNGLDAMKPKAQAVGKTCKACHDEFREK